MATAAPLLAEPVFLRRRDISGTCSALDICLAAERVSGKESIYGAQDIKGLWRVYPMSRDARNKLLIEGISLNGIAITLHDKNPFILRDSNTEIPATKLFISEIPISCSDRDIETALNRVGCVLRSSLILEKIRDNSGHLTRFVTGRRFCYINIPEKSLEHNLPVGHFTARLYYREQDKPQRKEIVCSKCLEPGHHVSVCQNPMTCRDCRQRGHKRGDPECLAFPPNSGRDGVHEMDSPDVENKESSDNEEEEQEGDRRKNENENRPAQEANDVNLLPQANKAPCGNEERGRQANRASTQSKIGFERRLVRSASSKRPRAADEGDSPSAAAATEAKRRDNREVKSSRPMQPPPPP